MESKIDDHFNAIGCDESFIESFETPVKQSSGGGLTSRHMSMRRVSRNSGRSHMNPTERLLLMELENMSRRMHILTCNHNKIIMSMSCMMKKIVNIEECMQSMMDKLDSIDLGETLNDACSAYDNENEEDVSDTLKSYDPEFDNEAY